MVASMVKVWVTVPPWPSLAVTTMVYLPSIMPLEPVTEGAFLDAS